MPSPNSIPAILASADLHPPPKFTDILEACPFDHMRNLSGSLTPDFFFTSLFVSSPRLRSTDTELTKLLLSPISNHPLLFVNGFAGSGKTTFLRSYARNHSEFFHRFLDFSDPVTAGAPDEPLAALLRQEIEEAPTVATLPIFFLLKRHSTSLSRFFKPKFIHRVRATRRLSLKKRIAHLLSYADFADCFFLYLLMMLRVHQPGRVQVVYYDNLDRVDLDFISDTLRQDFAALISGAAKICQLRLIGTASVDFMRDFRFVFCLRDANHAVINSHIIDSLGSKVRLMPLTLRFEPTFYRDMLERRLELAHSLMSSSKDDPEVVNAAQAMRGVLKIFIQHEDLDPYFSKVIVPLFNCDFKKISRLLCRVAEDRRTLVEELAGIIADNPKGLGPLALYGLRGSLLFFFVEILMSEDFLREYGFFQYPFTEDEGYCLHSRMVLTALLNSCRYFIEEDALDPDRGSDEASLGVLLDKCQGVYPLREVLETLADCFCLHERNWVNLVTIRNKAVRNRESFQDEMTLLEQRGMLELTLPREQNLRDSLADSERRSLDRIRIRVNPAGFTFLRYILIHFEYYSALAGNTRPLFAFGCAKNEEGRFEFEGVIERVTRLFAKHFRWMQTFYKNRFENSMGYTTSSYRTGAFSFKHFGTGHPVEEGYFHSTRVATSLVDYVDRFRRFVVARCLEEEVRSQANRVLVTHIGKFIGFLRASVDERATVFVEGFDARISKIAGSEYADIDTEIRLP